MSDTDELEEPRATDLGPGISTHKVLPRKCITVIYCLDLDTNRRRPRIVRCLHCYGKSTTDHRDIRGYAGGPPPVPRLFRWMTRGLAALDRYELERNRRVLLVGPVTICKGDAFL